MLNSGCKGFGACFRVLRRELNPAKERIKWKIKWNMKWKLGVRWGCIDEGFWDWKGHGGSERADIRD